MRFLQISGIGFVLILFSTIFVIGQVFSPNLQVDEGLVSTQYVPKILCGDDRTLYVTWSDTRDEGENIYFSRSKDGGRTWLAPNVRISDVPTGVYDGPAPMAIDEDGTLYTTWVFYNGTLRANKHILFAKSTNRGDTWTPDVQVDDSTNKSKSAPVVCVDTNKHIYIVWHDCKIDSMYGLHTFTVAPHDSFPVFVKHETPDGIPLGEYEYWVKVDEDRPFYAPPYRFETDPDRYYLFKDNFAFTVVEGISEGSNNIW